MHSKIKTIQWTGVWLYLIPRVTLTQESKPQLIVINSGGLGDRRQQTAYLVSLSPHPQGANLPPRLVMIFHFSPIHGRELCMFSRTSLPTLGPQNRESGLGTQQNASFLHLKINVPLPWGLWHPPLTWVVTWVTFLTSPCFSLPDSQPWRLAVTCGGAVGMLEPSVDQWCHGSVAPPVGGQSECREEEKTALSLYPHANVWRG